MVDNITYISYTFYIKFENMQKTLRHFGTVNQFFLYR
jgi:hypothetical protein